MNVEMIWCCKKGFSTQEKKNASCSSGNPAEEQKICWASTCVFRLEENHGPCHPHTPALNANTQCVQTGDLICTPTISTTKSHCIGWSRWKTWFYKQPATFMMLFAPQSLLKLLKKARSLIPHSGVQFWKKWKLNTYYIKYIEWAANSKLNY